MLHIINRDLIYNFWYITELVCSKDTEEDEEPLAGVGYAVPEEVLETAESPSDDDVGLGEVASSSEEATAKTPPSSELPPPSTAGTTRTTTISRRTTTTTTSRPTTVSTSTVVPTTQV